MHLVIFYSLSEIFPPWNIPHLQYIMIRMICIATFLFDMIEVWVLHVNIMYTLLL